MKPAPFKRRTQEINMATKAAAAAKTAATGAASADKQPRGGVDEIVITRIREAVMDVHIVGTSPLIMNQFAKKAWRELIFPGGRKNQSVKDSTLKHDPRAEFNEAAYVMRDPKADTLLAVLPTAFKKSLMTAALDLPGTKKAQIGRLLSVDWDRTHLWGLPKLHMSMVRMADVKRTPDVRTRVIVPEWACILRITFPEPTLNATSVANLIHAAGRYAGICEWRQEKGSGSFGSFRMCEHGAEDADWKRIVATGGRKVQIAAMQAAEAYDEDTAELLTWFDAEVRRRGFKVAA
jgi:hypothetical protein